MKKLLLTIPDFEDESTLKLFKEFHSLKKQGYLTKPQLIKILRWKSPRPLKHYETNDDESVKAITKLAFEMPNDKLKIHVLTALNGVNYPSASAILMFYDSLNYPVLDIRVWQQLHQAGLVTINAKGQGFTLRQWEIYLAVIRRLASSMNLSARQVEKEFLTTIRMLEQSNFTSIMANYRNLEIDFIERTLELIAQYEATMHKYEFERQFKHTLLVNCLLGLIVLPKERTISFLPQERIDETMKKNMGITETFLNEEIVYLKSMVIALRHSVAHFNIAFESKDENFLIDRIVFKDSQKGDDYIVASFVPTELLSFMRYYGYWLISVIQKYRK